MRQKKKVPRGLNLKGFEPYYIIIGIIIILLITVLVFLKNIPRENTVSEQYESYIEAPEPQPEKGPQTEPEGSPAEQSAESISSPAAVPEHPDVRKSAELAFVIDDVGNSIGQLKPFLELPFPVTFAIMPDRRYTRECASMIKAAGKEYILHQPMEAVGGEDPGESAIYTNMDSKEIKKILEHNFSQLPYAAGMNNHMGSAATSDPEVMSSIMEYLEENDLFFLDSFTISNSLGNKTAERYNVPYIKRNAMFLDNDSDKEAIHDAIDEGRKTAKKHGHAVMIGHVMTGELAETMLELYPDFIEDGFTLKEISELFIEMNNMDDKED